VVRGVQGMPGDMGQSVGKWPGGVQQSVAEREGAQQSMRERSRAWVSMTAQDMTGKWKSVKST
jgi:hypothetical protein